ncbi:BASS family bile acid:Na+ symporter [Nonomuraea polychroma]|uniref:BASS family bile acid:Na+ symporter n=1 Tax=Nonomuraea polychroma TaxID=46176 RepID=A0A438M041_9ACTN|nr:bile acid:sodium symporter family protein [Nonomuraea polychroma]RVX38977.1 BASS family bile acid:Na+ symporter [Nonomuraea polychroma]
MALAGVLLPIALAIIMLGLGLSLTIADFRRVVAYPKAAVVALTCQVVLLPAVCLGLVLAFGLPPALAVGMMLLAATPGGTTANLYSHLFGGDVALNVTLTAINSVLAVVTLPLVTNLSLSYFGDAGTLGLQFGKTLQVIALVLVPVAVGMAVRTFRPRFADRMESPVKIASVVILVLVILGALMQELDDLGGYIRSVGAITVLFSVISLAVGYWAPRLAGVGRRQAIASCMEIGIHNATLAITVALSPALLNNTQMAVPAATYGILMFFTGAAAGFLVRSRASSDAASEASTA